jgi:pimeloyl-ACP methyl ester carboxylesterase
VALELALANPALVGRLVVAGAAARFEAGLATAFARRILERFPLPRDNPFVNQFFNLLHGKKPEPGPLPRFIVERCWETDQSVMAGRLRALEEFDVADRLWQLEVPTLVIAGTRDVIVSPEHQAELARGIKTSRFEPIADGGHVGFLTHRNEVAAAVTRWLGSRSKAYR